MVDTLSPARAHVVSLFLEPLHVSPTSPLASVGHASDEAESSSAAIRRSVLARNQRIHLPDPREDEQLHQTRLGSVKQLQASWELLATKYGDIGLEDDDEIDLRTGLIVTDRGRVDRMEPAEFGARRPGEAESSDEEDGEYAESDVSDDSSSEDDGRPDLPRGWKSKEDREALEEFLKIDAERQKAFAKATAEEEAPAPIARGTDPLSEAPIPVTVSGDSTLDIAVEPVPRLCRESSSANSDTSLMTPLEMEEVFPVAKQGPSATPVAAIAFNPLSLDPLKYHPTLQPYQGSKGYRRCRVCTEAGGDRAAKAAYCKGRTTWKLCKFDDGTSTKETGRVSEERSITSLSDDSDRLPLGKDLHLHTLLSDGRGGTRMCPLCRRAGGELAKMAAYCRGRTNAKHCPLFPSDRRILSRSAESKASGSATSVASVGRHPDEKPAENEASLLSVVPDLQSASDHEMFHGAGDVDERGDVIAHTGSDHGDGDLPYRWEDHQSQHFSPDPESTPLVRGATPPIDDHPAAFETTALPELDYFRQDLVQPNRELPISSPALDEVIPRGLPLPQSGLTSARPESTDSAFTATPFADDPATTVPFTALPELDYFAKDDAMTADIPAPPRDGHSVRVESQSALPRRKKKRRFDVTDFHVAPQPETPQATSEYQDGDKGDPLYLPTLAYRTLAGGERQAKECRLCRAAGGEREEMAVYCRGRAWKTYCGFLTDRQRRKFKKGDASLSTCRSAGKYYTNVLYTQEGEVRQCRLCKKAGGDRADRAAQCPGRVWSKHCIRQHSTDSNDNEAFGSASAAHGPDTADEYESHGEQISLGEAALHQSRRLEENSELAGSHHGQYTYPGLGTEDSAVPLESSYAPQSDHGYLGEEAHLHSDRDVGSPLSSHSQSDDESSEDDWIEWKEPTEDDLALGYRSQMTWSRAKGPTGIRKCVACFEADEERATKSVYCPGRMRPKACIFSDGRLGVKQAKAAARTSLGSARPARHSETRRSSLDRSTPLVEAADIAKSPDVGPDYVDNIVYEADGITPRLCRECMGAGGPRRLKAAYCPGRAWKRHCVFRGGSKRQDKTAAAHGEQPTSRKTSRTKVPRVSSASITTDMNESAADAADDDPQMRQELNEVMTDVPPANPAGPASAIDLTGRSPIDLRAPSPIDVSASSPVGPKFVIHFEEPGAALPDLDAVGASVVDQTPDMDTVVPPAQLATAPDTPFAGSFGGVQAGYLPELGFTPCGKNAQSCASCSEAGGERALRALFCLGRQRNFDCPHEHGAGLKRSKDAQLDVLDDPFNIPSQPTLDWAASRLRQRDAAFTAPIGSFCPSVHFDQVRSAPSSDIPTSIAGPVGGEADEPVSTPGTSSADVSATAVERKRKRRQLKAASSPEPVPAVRNTSQGTPAKEDQALISKPGRPPKKRRSEIVDHLLALAALRFKADESYEWGMDEDVSGDEGASGCTGEL